jgi:mono/diheme cytochrome c family protein
MIKKSHSVLCAMLVGSALSFTGLAVGEPAVSPDMVKHGRYIAQISGCNDCHTPGYLIQDGKVPEQVWLTGDRFGWRGPWGTTYGPNLRLYVQNLTEDQWVQDARSMRRRPPMPWFNLNVMSEHDLRALYQYIVSLGEPGEPAPAYLPPDQEPPMPYASFPSPPKVN